MHLYTHSTHAQLVRGFPQSPDERTISSCSCAFFKRFNPRYRSSSLLSLYQVFCLTFRLHSNNPHVTIRNNTNLLFRIKPCIIRNNAWYYSDLLFRRTFFIPDSVLFVPCAFQSPGSSASVQRYSVGVVLHAHEFYLFLEGQVISLSYSSLKFLPIDILITTL